MTHDLFKSFAYNFGFTVKEIMISDLKEGVFFAKIVCENNGQSVEIDARPSDAIAIGLRFGVEIYTNDDILTEAGIVFTDESEEEPVIEEEPDKPKEPEKPKKMSDYSNDRLNELLEEALVSEDYERAAQIRDELNRRN